MSIWYEDLSDPDDLVKPHLGFIWGRYENVHAVTENENHVGPDCVKRKLKQDVRSMFISIFLLPARQENIKWASLIIVLTCSDHSEAPQISERSTWIFYSFRLLIDNHSLSLHTDQRPRKNPAINEALNTTILLRKYFGIFECFKLIIGIVVHLINGVMTRSIVDTLSELHSPILKGG